MRAELRDSSRLWRIELWGRLNSALWVLPSISCSPNTVSMVLPGLQLSSVLALDGGAGFNWS